jgi:biotin carboxyl carrier protein
MAARASRYLAQVKPRAGSLSKEERPKREVFVELLEDGHYAVTLDGVRHDLEALALPHGAVSMLLDGDSHAVEFEEKGDEVAVLLKSHLMTVDIVDERRARMREATAAFTVEGRQTINSPMPGKIVKVFVKVGDEVTEGQSVVVVEAMKMENELKAPKAGKVLEVTAVEGNTVENGARLVVIE